MAAAPCWRCAQRAKGAARRAALALELPEYQAAKAKAAERRAEGNALGGKSSVQIRTTSPEPVAPPVHAAAVAAQVAGVSTSYVEKAD